MYIDVFLYRCISMSKGKREHAGTADTSNKPTRKPRRDPGRNEKG
jgi:hypothetical protein